MWILELKGLSELKDVVNENLSQFFFVYHGREKSLS